MDRVMKAIDRRARIYGFEAPQKVAHTTPDGEEAQQQGIVVVSSPMTFRRVARKIYAKQ